VLDIFNEQMVRRYDSSGNVVKTIGKVPVRFGPKEKWWHEWSKHFDRVLPAISVYFTGIEFDNERNAGIHSRHIGSPNYDTGLYSKLEKPAPYDLLYTATIWARYNEDINQILENILPYFQPYVFITIAEPVTGDYLNVRVELEGVTNNSNTEYGHEEHRIISWDLNIRAKTWLFKAEEIGDLIKRVYVHWWGYDSTVVYSNIDGTGYQMVKPSSKFITGRRGGNRWAADIALSVTTGLDYAGGVLDWEYRIWEPGDRWNTSDSTRVWR
jgi:hypothetical protein